MWQRWTERARAVVWFAREEAIRLAQNCVSTEHIVLGLVRESDNVACRLLLGAYNIYPETVRAEVENQAKRGEGVTSPDMHLTAGGKRVIDLAYDEARRLDNNYIGTEHLLLGLIRESEGIAGRVLAQLGVDADRTRKAVLDLPR